MPVTTSRRFPGTALHPALAPALALAVLAAACGGADDGTATGAPGTAATPSPTVTATAPASPTTGQTPGPEPAATPAGATATGGGATAQPSSATPEPVTTSPATPTAGGSGLPPFTAPGRRTERAPSGEAMSVTAVRVARQSGFDRVVLELSSGGRPGWRVGYDDDPRRPGSGDRVDVAGGATLAVLVEGVGYPFDTGVDEYAGPRSLRPRDTAAVREVRVGAVFEGQYDAYVGVDRRRPYRVFRLDGPPRVVLDIAHEG
jgi:hypothetical protein